MKKLVLLFAALIISFYSFGQSYKYHPIFIYNFSKYIEWPASYANGDFVINVVGNNDAFKAVQNFAERKKSVKGQKIVIKKSSDISEVNNAHIVFITKSENVSKSDIKGQFGDQPALVITEQKGMAKDGSHINFRLNDEGKIRFDLNESTLHASGLKVANSLVSLAANTY